MIDYHPTQQDIIAAIGFVLLFCLVAHVARSLRKK